MEPDPTLRPYIIPTDKDKDEIIQDLLVENRRWMKQVLELQKRIHDLTMWIPAVNKPKNNKVVMVKGLDGENDLIICMGYCYNGKWYPDMAIEVSYYIDCIPEE